jgi:type III secretory pathway component EscR
VSLPVDSISFGGGRHSNMAVARNNLASLDKFMNSLTNSNIIEFYQHVAENLQELTAAKETATNLLVYLLPACQKQTISETH